jgi:hypothetical protein
MEPRCESTSLNWSLPSNPFPFRPAPGFSSRESLPSAILATNWVSLLPSVWFQTTLILVKEVHLNPDVCRGASLIDQMGVHRNSQPLLAIREVTLTPVAYISGTISNRIRDGAVVPGEVLLDINEIHGFLRAGLTAYKFPGRYYYRLCPPECDRCYT